MTDYIRVSDKETGHEYNISCFLLSEQEGVTSETEKVALARLLCETTTTEGLGEQKWSLADLTFTFDPQAAAGSDGKKAWELFKAGGNGFLIRRQGVKADTATPELAVGKLQARDTQAGVA